MRLQKIGSEREIALGIAPLYLFFGLSRDIDLRFFLSRVIDIRNI